MASRKQQQEAAVGGGVVYALGYLYSTTPGLNMDWLNMLYKPVTWLNGWIGTNVSWIQQNIPNTVMLPVLSFVVGYVLVLLLTNIKR